jgi:hypothetical protein
MSVTLKNRSLKMSPRGVITLPPSARKALGMEKGAGSRVGVEVERGAVVLTRRPDDEKTWRVSARGQLELGGDAKALLGTTPTRNYWLEADDDARTVRLYPFGDEKL